VSGKPLAMRTVARIAAMLIILLLTLGTSLVITGPFGLVVAAECLAGLGLIIALATVPHGARELPADRPASTRASLLWAWFWRRRAPAPPVQTADFPSYAKISSDLGWAPVSEWHYDHGVRPLLARLVTLVLAEHHRVDVATDPARARQLVGDEIWPLVDPFRPPSLDSKAPGADLRTLARIVDRLEQL
jgi:hypothetical protein